MDERDCIGCRFWLNKPYLSESGGMGICRRHAPIATGGMMSNVETAWPVTGEAEWCGDWEDGASEAEFAEVYKCETCEDGAKFDADWPGWNCPKCGLDCGPF